jgi:hypothetical protein
MYKPNTPSLKELAQAGNGSTSDFVNRYLQTNGVDHRGDRSVVFCNDGPASMVSMDVGTIYGPSEVARQEMPTHYEPQTHNPLQGLYTQQEASSLPTQ